MLDLQEVNLSETRFYQDVLQKGESNLLLRQLQRRCGVLEIDYLRQASPTTGSSQIPNHRPIGSSR
jgi:hypothetical protein